ncbi:MAG: methyltransferase domain-containing protein [Patescibacteria group bacterium]
MEKSEAIKILQETEQGYDRIAEKFSETRKRFWGDLEFIKDYVSGGESVLDYGCGNGRLLELFSEKNIDYTGLDISGKMVNLAKGKYQDPLVKFRKITSFDSLTFPGNYFNAVYSIAVFHHLPSQALRQKVAKELYRVTQMGGVIVISAWNLWQKKYCGNILVNWANKLIGRSQLDWNDCWIDFKDNRGNVFNRYHHAFGKRELGRLFSQAGFSIERCKIVNKKNIIFVGRKK